jgi:multiple sugar transport system substrate-binding protein
MYWRTDVADKAGVGEAPADAESFEAMLQELQKAGAGQPFWMPTKWPSHLMFLSLLWQNGGEPYSQDGSEATFDSDEGVAALTWQVEQIKKGYSPEDVAIDTQYVALKNGKNVVTWDGIWQINDLKSNETPFGIATIPTIGDSYAVWANSHNFFVTRQATQDDNKYDAARVFIDWMSKQSADWAGAGMIPARTSVRESADVQGTTQAPVAQQIDGMRFLPAVPGLGQVQTATLEVAVNEATLMKKSPADALREAAAAATEQMQANLEKFGS